MQRTNLTKASILDGWKIFYISCALANKKRFVAEIDMQMRANFEFDVFL